MPTEHECHYRSKFYFLKKDLHIITLKVLKLSDLMWHIFDKYKSSFYLHVKYQTK